MITDDIFEWLSDVSAERSSMRVGDWFFLASDVGLSRSENEDRVAVLRVSSRNQTFWCACLCDGMGGMVGGAEAAALAVSVFFSSLISLRRDQPMARLRQASMEASVEVSKQVSGGGATLSAVLVEAGETYTLNIGDSRIYEASQGDLLRLTTDDTMKEAYGAEGRGLLQYIGMKSGLVPHTKKIDRTGDLLLLTSDGAHSVGEAVIAAYSSVAKTDEQLANRILDTANWLGGLDNASVIVLRPKRIDYPVSPPTISDISVWSPQGRMKIAWPSNSYGSAQSKADAIVSPVTQNPESSADAENEIGAPNQASEVSNDQVKPPGPTAKKKPRKRQGKKQEQIEIGFSDEEDN